MIPISGIKQLDDRGLPGLFLYFLQIEESASAELSLPELVGRLRNRLGDACRNQFDERLFQVGYTDQQFDEGALQRYTVRRQRWFQVTTGFPRLLEPDLPAGVVEVKFSVALADCAPHGASARGRDVCPVGSEFMSVDSHEFSAFLAQLHARVSDRSTEVTGDLGEEVLGVAFREAAFTQVVLEMLEDLGQVSGAEDCFFEKLVGRQKVRVNGWNFEEDDAQLDVVTTILRDPDSPPDSARSELFRVARQASYLIPVAGRGFHKEVEPASDVFAMLQRVHEVIGRVERVRLIVLVDGTAVNPSGLEVDLDGVEVRIDVWDHQRLFRAQTSGFRTNQSPSTSRSGLVSRSLALRFHRRQQTTEHISQSFPAHFSTTCITSSDPDFWNSTSALF